VEGTLWGGTGGQQGISDIVRSHEAEAARVTGATLASERSNSFCSRILDCLIVRSDPTNTLAVVDRIITQGFVQVNPPVFPDRVSI